MSANLLVELFTEELPPKALKRLGDAFANGIADGLRGVALLDATSKVKAFATPRRLAVYITSVLEKGRDRPLEQKLMPAAVARKGDGGWSDALRKKLAALDKGALADAPLNTKVGTDSLTIKPDGKADSVYLRSIEPGKSLESALAESIEQAIAKLPIPKVMSYQLADGATTVKFVRPAHGLIALHGGDLLNVAVLGLQAGRITHGHRFQGAKDIKLDRADEYEATLERDGRVMADFEVRKADIARQLGEKATALKSSLGQEADYAPLLDEVTALVEYPTVYVGMFEQEFLTVPQECLILTMRQNQKYFPLFDDAGKLTNMFLIVSNMRLADSRNVVEGNQRVVRPRLADARFFFETDKKTKLADRVPQLANVVYHNRLGSQLDRSTRVESLAVSIPRMLAFSEENTRLAAHLAKADLLTAMVGEFPELQGIMGNHYAQADGFPEEVCQAIEEHYRPRFAGDLLPSTQAGTFVSLADKLETLVGMFGIGQQPSGDKDPYALRRHALGVIRILIEKNLSLNIDVLFRHAVNTFYGIQGFSDPTNELFDFVLERLRSYLREQGFSVHEIEAVLAIKPTQINQVITRLHAVRTFSTLPEAQSLAAANKRIGNILKKSDAVVGIADPNLMSESAEIDLYRSIVEAKQVVETRYEARQYTESLQALAGLRPVVDRFFEQVLVNVEDMNVRVNRLRILAELNLLMNKVADISKLAA